MLNHIQTYAMLCMIKVQNAWKRFVKEEHGVSNIISMLIIVAIVLALALAFRTQIGNLVKSLWNQMVAGGNPDANPTIPTWG